MNDLSNVLFGEERKMMILKYIQQHSRASVQELSRVLNVSESTVRRDLKELEDEKMLHRTHGGAVSLQGVNFEPTFMEKGVKYQREKVAIAKKAAELIDDGDTILLDSGTTTFHLLSELHRFSELTIVTNCPLFVEYIQDRPTIELIVVGGIYRRGTAALVGPITEQLIRSVKVDKAFIGMNGIDLHDGLTTPNIMEASTKRQMIKSAKQVILLTDHSKVGKVSFAKVAEISDIDICVIDNGVPLEFVKGLEEQGVEVHVVDP
ncbi:DeoR/GlpR family DNA-binding transcription regulator [Collibacillus ludicampi]|uniref:DeoR/GlpR family DNA-binding transcription regulator n=1 Tax=Collibacillus ludicampi TaxID=2771369 RepID=UPI002494548E|nr:DeoR/GlpR family DNA-binding transcription regulator [Collibacillus ludicampi]